MYILDTDTWSLAFFGHQQVSERLRQVDVDEIGLSIITRIEVLQGRFAAILKAADGLELLRALERLAESERKLEPVGIVPVNAAAIAEFDRLREDKKLRKIGRADLLIGCIALANRATLVTRNRRHFEQIPGLTLENWAD
jgi:tRNA(fMet)-specific endonuclease VapC